MGLFQKRKNPQQDVTDRIVATLKTGAPPWVQSWSQTPGANVPCNAITGRPYSGVNVLLLWLGKTWVTPRFLTVKQANAVGGRVRKGEHGTGIYFVGDWTPKDQETVDDEAARSKRFLKRFVVFNVDQCEDLPAKIAAPGTGRPRHHDARDPMIEAFIATTGADIREGDRGPYYVPSDDRIYIPAFGRFDSATAYYNVLSHELIHWTGAPKRLGRDLAKRFDKQRYAAEELVAELGAAFICADFAIDSAMPAASYIASWIELLENDTRAIFVCASAASKAVDYLKELALREQPQAAE